MGFREATRQNFVELPNQNYSAGNTVYIPLPKVGLLSKLKLYIKGTMTVTPGTGTATLSERAPWNLIKRIRLTANSGASIFDVSGYGTYLINNLQKYGQSPDKSIFDRGISTEVYNCGVAAGANTWAMCLDIPIAINDSEAIGLVLLQNNATQLQLEITFANETGANDISAPVVVTGNAAASFVGKVGCMMEFFNVPRTAQDYPSLNVVHQWLEQQDAITSAGAFTKSLLRGNTYMRLMHYLTLNNKLDTGNVDQLRILYNTSEIPYTISDIAQLHMQRSRYGMDLPKGTFVHDWFYSKGLVSLGDSRDFINSATVTEFQSEITINQSASVPAGSSFVNTITEQLIRIA